MSKSDREKRDAQRAARRADRLAQRAEQRAKRKDELAQHAAERTERLAERAQRRPRRELDLDQSIEDLVDQVTSKWTRKAEEWIDEQSTRLFDENGDTDDADDAYDEARASADEARDRAGAAREKARRAQQRASEYGPDELNGEGIDAMYDNTNGDAQGDKKRQGRASRDASRRRRRRRAQRSSWDKWDWGFDTWHGLGRSYRNRRRGNLYRDKRNKKICGVCAGTAEYFAVKTWQVRLVAVMGLIFIPSVAISVYFITYFLMDDKPYYRQVTDRFNEMEDDDEREPRPVKKRRKPRREDGPPQVSNKEAMRTAKEKFSDIEDRLRGMETHVTSSTFELQRELKKISGEDS